MANQEEFTKWFKFKFDEWEDQRWKDGRRKTLTDLQKHLDIDQNLLSRWLGGKDIPRGELVHKIAKLGEEVYEILGIQKPRNNH